MRLLFFIVLWNAAALSQDERFYRRIFTDELQIKKKKEEPKIIAQTPHYMIDINRDGEPERLQAVKKDGQDFFRISDRFGQEVFEAKLDAKGYNSSLYQVRLKTLANGVEALILMFDEGNTGTAVFQSTARVYIAVVEDGNLKNIYFHKGPAFYYEKEKLDVSYSRRQYNVNAIDFNKDGVKEVAVSYGHIQRILFYQGKGKWREL